MYDNLINNTNLDDKTQKLELITKLLALSLAQHELNDHGSNLASVIQYIDDDVFSSENKSLLNEAQNLIKQSIALIDEEYENKNIVNETRSQPRKPVNMSVRVRLSDSNDFISARVGDISWGGILITTQNRIELQNSSITLLIPYTENDEIHIQGQLVREWVSEGYYNYAIRFALLSYLDEKKYASLLESLFISPIHEKHNISYTRFAHVIDLTFWDLVELEDSLNKAASGHLSITFPDPIELNKSVVVEFEYPELNRSLSFRARVESSEKIWVSEFQMYHIKLHFEHPENDLRSAIDNFIKSLDQGNGDKTFKSRWK